MYTYIYIYISERKMHAKLCFAVPVRAFFFSSKAVTKAASNATSKVKQYVKQRVKQQVKQSKTVTCYEHSARPERVREKRCHEVHL